MAILLSQSLSLSLIEGRRGGWLKQSEGVSSTEKAWGGFNARTVESVVSDLWGFAGRQTATV